MRCNRQGCEAAATHHLHFLAWGQGVRKVKATAVMGVLRLPLCYHHASMAEADEGLFSAETWDMVVKEVRKRGQDTPRIEDVQIVPVAGLPGTTNEPEGTMQ